MSNQGFIKANNDSIQHLLDIYEHNLTVLKPNSQKGKIAIESTKRKLNYFNDKIEQYYKAKRQAEKSKKSLPIPRIKLSLVQRLTGYL